jgi:hypothetical protein
VIVTAIIPAKHMTKDTLDGLLTKRRPSRPRMTRAILTSFLLGSGLFLLVAASPGCQDQGVGDPCTPEQEYDPSFLGFDEKEVNVESKSFQCRTRICLVNHFRGRASCTYGQSVDGVPPSGAPPADCHVPGDATQKITGLTVPTDAASFRDPRKKALVAPQCKDRSADKTVYCSCRCADINGNQPSGETFCSCPDGFSCTPLVTSIGAGNEGLTGSYCILNNTGYNKDTACNQGDCDPNTNKCATR